MESLFILIPIAIVIVAIAVFVFFWAVKNGQFEDLDAEAKRILFDNEKQGARASSAEKNKSLDQPIEKTEQGK